MSATIDQRRLCRSQQITWNICVQAHPCFVLSLLLIALWRCSIALNIYICTDQGAASHEIWRSPAWDLVWKHFFSTQCSKAVLHATTNARFFYMGIAAAPLACANAVHGYACVACAMCDVVCRHIMVPAMCGILWRGTSN